jgi:hypothetical protein
MAMATIAWKLAQPQCHPLACIAEELALIAAVRRGEALLGEQGKEADFRFVRGLRIRPKILLPTMKAGGSALNLSKGPSG